MYVCPLEGITDEEANLDAPGNRLSCGFRQRRDKIRSPFFGRSREAEKSTRTESPGNQGVLVGATHSGSVLESPIAPRGSEHSPLALSKTPISQTPRAPDSAPNDEKTPSDPDLRLLTMRWPTLPEHIRQAVLALVRSIPDKDQTP